MRWRRKKLKGEEVKWFRRRKDNQRGDRRQRFVTFRLRGAEGRGDDEVLPWQCGACWDVRGGQDRSESLKSCD